MMGPQPEISVPVQAIYANNTMFFLFFGPNCSGAGAKKSQDVGAGAKKIRCPELELKPEREI